MENLNQSIKNKIPHNILIFSLVVPLLVFQHSIILFLVYFILGIASISSIDEMEYDSEISKYRIPTILFVGLSFISFLSLFVCFCLIFFDVMSKKFFIKDMGNMFSIVNSVITFIVTCIFINFKQKIYKTSTSILSLIKNGVILLLLYISFILHINSFATYANFVYIIKQKDCNGACVHVGVGDLSPIFKKDTKYYPLVVQDNYTNPNCGVFGCQNHPKEDWKFKIIRSSDIKPSLSGGYRDEKS